MTGRPWDASYHDGPAPWDVGEAQPAIVALASTGAIAGPVLDVGCGTGENAILLASLGLTVVGVDVAETALSMARAKAAARGLDAEFVSADAFELQRMGRRFTTILDCGMFHTCDGDERLRYATSLASAVAPGGTVYVLCFSDEGPDTGPHPITRHDLRAAFSSTAGWTVRAIDRARVLTRFHEHGAPAWLATIDRT
jgi:SAM-dependent methyltransferase